MHALVPKRHSEYEIVYVLSPSTTPAGATKVGDIIREAVEGHEGKILKVDLWGIRKLAYRIKSQKQGIYYYIRFVGTQHVVEEMERRLRINDAVLRFLTVRLSERPVDPASYAVDEEESSFKPIDDILANLQAGDEEQTETPEGAKEGEEKVTTEGETEGEAKQEPAKEDSTKEDSSEPAASEDAPEVEVAPEKEADKDSSDDQDEKKD